MYKTKVCSGQFIFINGVKVYIETRSGRGEVKVFIDGPKEEFKVKKEPLNDYRERTRARIL